MNTTHLDRLRQILIEQLSAEEWQELRRALGVNAADLAPPAASDARALEMARRALSILEQQAAGYTSLTMPVHLRIQLEDKRAEVAALERARPDSGNRLEQVNSVLAHLSTRGQIPALRTVGRRLRPDLAWDADAGMLWPPVMLALPPALPPIEHGGTLWIATQSYPPAEQCARLHALDAATGTERWSETFAQGVMAGLARIPGRDAVVVSLFSADLLHGAAHILAFDGAGRRIWTAAPGGLRVTGVAVGNGRVYASVADARALLTLDAASGRELARVALPLPPMLTAPTLVGRELYLPCRGSALLALDVGGDARWRYDFSAASASDGMDKPPAVAGALVICALKSGRVVALRRSDGGVLWQVEVGPPGKALSAPAVSGELVYVGARDGLHALDTRTGREVWQHPTRHYIAARPIARGNVVYAACRDHHLYALDATTGHPLWQTEAEHGLKVAPVVKDEAIVSVDRVGQVRAVRYPDHLRPPKPESVPLPADDDAFATLTLRIAPRQPEKGYPVDMALDVPGRDEMLEMERRYIPAEALLPWGGIADVGEAGRKLFQALVERSRYARAWGFVEGQAPQRRIQLKIDRDAPELHRLPWELLRDKTLFSADANTPFSRSMPSATPWGDVITGHALRVLVLLSDPVDAGALGLAPLPMAEYRELFAALSADGPFQFDVMPAPVTLARMEQRLRGERYHGLHFVGHGAFHEQRAEAALYFQREDGAAERVGGAAICDALARLHYQSRPALVFLAACHSATVAWDNPFVGLGPMLGRVGVPVVIAMRDAVQMAVARNLARVFYTQLMTHGVVDRAMNEARGTLDTLNHPQAAAAVLFMRLKSGRLWQPT